jgi:hypothetical protein
MIEVKVEQATGVRGRSAASIETAPIPASVRLSRTASNSPSFSNLSMPLSEPAFERTASWIAAALGSRRAIRSF